MNFFEFMLFDDNTIQKSNLPLFINWTLIYSQLICDKIMMDRCLRGLMPHFGARWNHKFFSFTAGQSFSVVNHRTFGYIFNLSDDFIMGRLKKLNQLFAQSQSPEKHQAIKPFIEVVNKSLKYEKIPFEKRIDREFNIFEVVAYCLFRQMHERPCFQIQDQQLFLSKYIQERNYFFERLQNYIAALKSIENQQCQRTAKSIPAFNKNYIVNCEMKYAKKQIFRRFYQLCQFAENSQIIFNLRIFSKKISQQYQQVAIYIKDGFYDRFNNHNESLQIGKRLKKKGQYHPLIIEQIMSLFSDDIVNGYYTPLSNLQSRFKDISQLKSKKDQKETDQYSIHTISFVPSMVTVKLNNKTEGLKNKNIFISGTRQMGKSMSLLMLLILRGYIDSEQRNLLFPQSTIQGISQSIYLCILQNSWKQLPRSTFISIEIITKKIFQNLKQDQSKLKKADKYKQDIIQLLGLIKPKTRGIIFDQYSSFANTIYRKDSNQPNLSPEDEELYQFCKYIFHTVYNYKGYYVACCSSIAFEVSKIHRHLISMRQDINTYFMPQEFEQKQAIHLLIVWLRRSYYTLQFTKNNDLNGQSGIKIQGQKQNQLQKNIGEESKYKQKESLWPINPKLKKIKEQIDAFVKLIEKNSQNIKFQGLMSVIKSCAQQLVQYLFQNPQKKLTLQMIHKTMQQHRVNHYSNLIFQWLKAAQNMENQQFVRKRIIRYSLNKIPLPKIRSLFYSLKPQFPKFLLNYTFVQQYYASREGNQLACQVEPISQLIWKQVQFMCQQKDRGEWAKNMHKLYKNMNTLAFENMCGVQFQMSFKQALLQETYIKQTPFLQKMFELFFPEEKSLCKQFKKIHIESAANIEDTVLFTAENLVFKQIMKQINKELKLNQEQNILFSFSLNFKMPGCDRYLIKVKNNKNNQIKKSKASIIHIEQDINKNKRHLFVTNDRIQNRIILTDEQLKRIKQKGYYQIFKQQFAKNQIDLIDYNIALVTGHKAKYLQINDEQLKGLNTKVINFNELQATNETHLFAQRILSIYAQICHTNQTEGRNIEIDHQMALELQKCSKQQQKMIDQQVKQRSYIRKAELHNLKQN